MLTWAAQRERCARSCSSERLLPQLRPVVLVAVAVVAVQREVLDEVARRQPVVVAARRHQPEFLQRPWAVRSRHAGGLFLNRRPEA